MFATILYFMVGLADRDSASNFFTYLGLLFVFALLMNQQLAVFASFASAGELNAYSACVVLLLILFGGFIIVPVRRWIYELTRSNRYFGSGSQSLDAVHSHLFLSSIWRHLGYDSSLLLVDLLVES
jgi:hypothetical protein